MSYGLQHFTPAELAEQANALSSFEGYAGDPEEFYLGYADELDFNAPGASNFAGERLEQFTFTVDSNNDANNLRFLILSGISGYQPRTLTLPLTYGAPSSGVTPVATTGPVTILARPNGLMSDGFFIDLNGVGTSTSVGNTGGLTANSLSNGSIYAFQEFIRNNPTMLRRIKVVATKDTQMDTPLVVRDLNPYKRLTETPLYPGNVQDQNVQQTKIAVFNVNQVIGPNTEIEYAIQTDSQITVTLFLGARVDMGRKLQTRSNIAQNYMTAAGGRQAVNTAQNLRRIGGR